MYGTDGMAKIVALYSRYDDSLIPGVICLLVIIVIIGILLGIVKWLESAIAHNEEHIKQYQLQNQRRAMLPYRMKWVVERWADFEDEKICAVCVDAEKYVAEFGGLYPKLTIPPDDQLFTTNISSVESKQHEASPNVSGIKSPLSTKNAGDVFYTSRYAHIVLEQLPDDTTLCMLKDFWRGTEFDEHSNNYATSAIRKYLNTEFLAELSKEVNIDDIIPMKINLTDFVRISDYKSVVDKIGLITYSQYKKYANIFEQHNPNGWWWTATPGKASGNYDIGELDTVILVDSLVRDQFMLYYVDGIGVRPIYKLRSSIIIET